MLNIAYNDIAANVMQQKQGCGLRSKGGQCEKKRTTESTSSTNSRWQS